MQTDNQNMFRSFFYIIFCVQEHMPFARKEFCCGSGDIQTSMSGEYAVP
jgi:hypothetical protein